VLVGAAWLWWDGLMRISQKLEYACRALAQLARHHDGRSLTRLEELAQREAVPGGFLVQILTDLKRAGIVESRRGSSGGYLLAREPSTITLRQVVEAVEPALLACAVANDGESGPAVRQVWLTASKAWQNSLDEVSLEAIAQQPGGNMFYI
jgi:Rrf2 family transcriptional regulator, cysteine metabolism repressor